MSVIIKKIQNTNESNAKTNGKWYPRVVNIGTMNLDALCEHIQEHGFDVPIFEIKDQIVKVSFPNIHYLRAENLHQGDTNLMSHYEGVIEGVIEGVGKDIKEKLASILCVLHKQPGLRTTMLSNKTDIPVKSVERYVKRLKDAGLIKYSGSSKSGGYFLSDTIWGE